MKGYKCLFVVSCSHRCNFYTVILRKHHCLPVRANGAFYAKLAQQDNLNPVVVGVEAGREGGQGAWADKIRRCCCRISSFNFSRLLSLVEVKSVCWGGGVSHYSYIWPGGDSRPARNSQAGTSTTSSAWSPFSLATTLYSTRWPSIRMRWPSPRMARK